MAEKVINGRTFKVDPPLAIRAIQLQARTVRMLGAAMEKHLEVITKAMNNPNGLSAQEFGLAILPALFDFFEKHEPHEVTDFIQEVLTYVTMQRPSGAFEPADLDGDFTGQLQDIFPVCKFALEVTLVDFFPGQNRSGSRASRAMN